MEKLIWLDETKQEVIGDDGDYPATIRFFFISNGIFLLNKSN